MELILKKDVEGLGFKDDVVTVKNGYGRNFLIPTGKAILATESAKKVLAENLKQKAFKEKSIIDAAKKTATKISKLELKISAKVGPDGKLFGSISNADMAKALLDKKIEVEKENISIQELDTIIGSGANQRVTKSDILNYLNNRSGSRNNIEKEVTKTIYKQSISINGDDEIIAMDRMRKMIADHMVNSVHTAPHVTSFVEADVTNLVNWRNKMKKSFEEKEGEKLTFTPIFIEAIAKALRDFLEVNSSIDGDNIIIKIPNKNYHSLSLKNGY